MNNRQSITRMLAGLLSLALILTLIPLGGVPARAAPPAQDGSPTVFINEIHYDNTGTDEGEAIEIAGPAGTDLTGWSIVLYNGSGGAPYDTTALSGVIPNQQNGFGTLYFSYPTNGIQNGSPDGIALVGPGDNVVQFLSYEGSFTAVGGPADGMTSTDIGVSEGSSTAVGDSLQLTGTGTTYDDFTWAGPEPNTFGLVNTGQTFGGAAPFINEIHYDNAGTDTGEAIEVAGPAGTDLNGWSLVLYNGNGGASYDTIALNGTISDQQNGFGTLFFDTQGIQNGSPDGVALVDPSDNVIQFLSYEGSFTAVGGPADGMASNDIGVSESSSTPVGDSLQLTGTGTTYDSFTWAGPEPNTFGQVNIDQTFGEIVNAPVMVDCGPALVAFQGKSASTTVSASDSDGTVVDIAITDISPAPTSGTISLSDLVPAEGEGGTATATVTVDSNVALGAYAVTLTATNNDDTPQTGTCVLSVTVNEILTIGQVQGEVTDTDNGLTFESPYVGQTVFIQGVIYEKTLARTSAGGPNYGFFIQNTAATADGNPLTSDGIFVFMSRFTDLIGGYVPQVGDEVILSGNVSEYFNLTELTSASAQLVVRTGVDLDAEVPAFEVNPPDDLADANRYWERHEGMRAKVPAGSLATSGRDVFASTLDGEAWFIRGDSAVAQRADPYARRVFRDPHPLDDIPEQLFDNGNGYRIVLGSLGIKATEDDNTVLIAPVRTFDSMAEAAVGGVYFSFSKYQIMVEQQLSLSQGVDPAGNNPPEVFDRTREYSVVTFNMENLYDYRDDPFDGCDFTGNSGCPGVNPPFDYVPASDAAYQARLHEIAEQIVDDLHSPDVIMAQEAEDQDICTVTDETLTCSTTDNADGKPDTLQELATVIYGLGGPAYDAAYDRDGADDRGIVSAFLYRTDRVQLLPAQTDDPVLGSNPQVIYRSDALPYNTDVQNPKALNAVLPADVDTSTGVDGDNVFTRAPQVGLFRVWRDGMGASVFTDLYLSDNHFSSGPDSRVGQRTEQAAYNAAIVDALQTAFPGVYVSVGGDLNVYPRPDDPFAPGSPLYPSDQLAALYNQGMTNLYDFLVTEVPVSAYSYVYQGQAQTLDQMFVTPIFVNDLVKFRASHINSDFPSDHFGDGPRGTSDHDPQVARYMALTLHGLEALVRYYDASGDITGNNTTRILLDRLERAQRYKDDGQQQAYRAQLQAFINQVQGFAPQFVTQAAADVLVQEVMLLQRL
jgi:predicted extracellular nuclease